jgi:hypothetical protein
MFEDLPGEFGVAAGDEEKVALDDSRDGVPRLVDISSDIRDDPG